MRNVIKIVLTAALVLSGANSFAETAKTVGDIDMLQGQRVYYEALAAVKKAKNESDLQASGGVQSTPQFSPMQSQPGTIQNSSQIQITKISGGASGMKVNLRTSEGSESVYKTGDTIPGGLKILQISMNGVSVQDIKTGKKFSIN